MTAVSQPPPQAAAAEIRTARSDLSQPAASADQPGESGWRAGAAAAVEALDGSQRKLLLARLAATDPDAVAAGLAWLERWHAACDERRRADRHRKAKDRRRRQRAARAGS